jgi:hypothetical protein
MLTPLIAMWCPVARIPRNPLGRTTVLHNRKATYSPWFDTHSMGSSINTFLLGHFRPYSRGILVSLLSTGTCGT